MKSITHKEQLERWEKEHQKPTVLLQMDAPEASSSVEKFLEFLKTKGKNPVKLRGIEMCCGKGRNITWLASEGVEAIGADFSSAAIKEAKERARRMGVEDKAHFIVQDATKPYPIEDESIDFAIDCFGSTDIESVEGRKAALENIIKILKPGGYLMLYLLSTDDEFHKDMIKKYPGPDSGSFIHPVNGKYEKAFSEDEIKEFYGKLNLVTLERMAKRPTFFGKTYNAKHIWAVLQKPVI